MAANLPLASGRSASTIKATALPRLLDKDFEPWINGALFPF
jgi:hypothetical protein